MALALFGVTELPLFERFAPRQKVEQYLIDLRFRARGRLEPHPQIALVCIRNEAPRASDFAPEELAASEALRLMVERSFPWNRAVYALLLDRLFAAGARVVALDVIFGSAQHFETGPDGDAALRAALEKYRGRVEIGWKISAQGEEHGLHEVRFSYPPPSILPEDREEFSGYVFHYLDNDMVYRRVDYRTSELREMNMEPEGADLLSFAAKAVRQATGKEPPAGYRQLINYQGGAKTYIHLPLENVFLDRAINESRQFDFGKVFKDKIVFVGVTANILHDTVNTPFGEMAGVEMHAQVAADLLAGTTLRESSAQANRYSALACVLLPALVLLSVRGALPQTALLVSLVAGFCVAAQIAFAHYRMVIPMTAPLLCLVGTGSGGVIFQWLLEQAQRRRLRGVLNVHLSKNVADVILAERQSFEAALRGKTKLVTVLFSDIRSFTSWSESVSPAQLVAQLNEYFLAMVDPILAQDGTLQKFIGDAILAAWGDTYSRGAAEDATRAVRAALAMRDALVRVNEGWREREDRRELTTGIGINHGEVTVGEVGHPVRREFTVLGDAINLAARLESATKQFHADILIGGSVEILTRHAFLYRRVDRAAFMGKKQPVEVFTPLSASTLPPPSWLADYHLAIDLYRARQFSEAAALFQTVNAVLDGGDFLCRMYAERCEECVRTPPAAEWDGAHILKEK